MDRKSTERFSTTVEHYDRYRPSYPVEVLDFMQRELNLNPASTIADIGSGTGKLTRLFLENGNPVYAVEPNEPMRRAAENTLGKYPNFTSVPAKAENTGLEPGSVDFVLAGQAFHWFDIPAFRRECRRILRPGGYVVLIWNKRIDDQSSFMKAYNDFLDIYSTDLREINPRRIKHKHFVAFYGSDRYQTVHFNHFQEFDRKGLRGRYLSCSYAFGENHPRHQEAMQELGDLFEKYQEGGLVKMWYRAEVYSGKIKYENYA